MTMLGAWIFWLIGIFGLQGLCRLIRFEREVHHTIADYVKYRLVIIPFSFLRRLDSLKYTSVIALISIAYLVVLVLAHFFKGDTMAERGVLRAVQPESTVAFLSSFPVIVFAFTCHQNVGCPSLIARNCADRRLQMFSILNEISNNSQFRTTAVIVASVGSAAFLYVLVAITGYLSFGNAVGGNVIAMCKPTHFESYPFFAYTCQTPLQ